MDGAFSVGLNIHLCTYGLGVSGYKLAGVSFLQIALYPTAPSSEKFDSLGLRNERFL